MGTDGGVYVDTDVDGTIDAWDNDSDDDGLVDALELFVDSDLDGLLDLRDPDSDDDGVGDAGDNCPTVRNLGQSNLDGDAFGDACDPNADGDASLFGGLRYLFDLLRVADITGV